VFDALPGHVGNVEQAVHPTQVDEGAVVGEVFDDTFDRHALLQGGEQFFALGGGGFFQYRTARYHHVVALLIELDDFEFEFFAFQVGGFAHRAHVHQRAGQEGANTPHVHGKAAFDLAADNAFDHLVLFVSGFQYFPGFGALGLFPRQAGFAPAVFDRFQGNLYFVAHL